jgi:TRAP-type C4-dicarboxylate transport system permease small subunit
VRTLARVSEVLERLLELVVMLLLMALTLVVVVGVVYRKAGDSLSWYDEIASINLAWLTYYGAALAALKRAHIGFDGLIRVFSPRWRLAALVVGEACVLGFFIILGWTGWIVLKALAGDTLVSLPEISVQITQSVIPIGALLFVVCQLVSLPGYLRSLRGSGADPHGASAREAADPKGAAQ